MKSIKWLLGIGICLLLLIVVFVMALFLKGDNITKEEVQKCINEEMQKSFGNAVQNNDYVIILLQRTSTITVDEISQEGNEIIAKCTIKAQNVRQAILKMIEEFETSGLNGDLDEKIKEYVDNAQSLSHQCEIRLFKNEEDMLTVGEISYEIYDAYMGGYLTCAQEVLEQMGDYLNG